MKRTTRMKKLASAIVMAMMMLSAPVTASATGGRITDNSVEAHEEAEWDVNADGIVSIADAVRLNLFIAEALSEEKIVIKDFDNDGFITIGDSVMLLKHLAEMAETETTTTETTTTTSTSTTTTTTQTEPEETTTTTTTSTTPTTTTTTTTSTTTSTTTTTTTTTTTSTTTTTTTTETTSTTTTTETTTTPVETGRFDITDPQGNVIPENTYTTLLDFLEEQGGGVDYEIGWKEEEMFFAAVVLDEYWENYFAATGCYWYENPSVFYDKFKVELEQQYSDPMDVIFLDYIQNCKCILWRYVDEDYKESCSLTEANFLMVDGKEIVFFPTDEFELTAWIAFPC